MPANRLIDETSPYLLQHAHNPVDWYPWGEAALGRARQENKPILVSIGYSACHWCHVMEHESFENEDVARVMNELFINIKVDREERPDLDKIYQTAHQVLTRRPGGWPLNMFLTPDDHMPFFGGTYFPKNSKYGMPGFVEVLRHVAGVYRDRNDAVRSQNEEVREIFARLQPAGAAPGNRPDARLLARAASELKGQYDARHGGFGNAPKFPHPTSIELCLRLWARSRTNGDEDRELLDIAQHTLTAMARGGIYDQLGGGFCRYSVDDEWMIPHFEKMLYDNAQLITLYADMHAATGEAANGPSLARGPRLDPIGDSLFARTAEGIGEWVMREMQAPAGGYYSSLDADSEGHEGKYYVWDTDELRALLTADEWALIEARYGLRGKPNFEGRWNLHVRADAATLAAQSGLSQTEVTARLASAHRKLLAARAQRVRPGRDDKILTSWNALMIKGMARAAWRLGRADFLDSAERAFDFLRATLWRNGRLLATHKDGKSHLTAYLDDYVFLMDAGLELLAAHWRDEVFEFVRQLAAVLQEHFEDESRGGFFFTADDHERLVYRPKPASDEALPSGNGVAAQVFVRLGHLLGDSDYLDIAGRVLDALCGSIGEHPSAHGSLLIALDEQLSPPQTVIVRGRAAETVPWLALARRGFVPWRLALAIPADAGNLPAALAGRGLQGNVTAYVCAGHACRAPQTDFAGFSAELAATT